MKASSLIRWVPGLFFLSGIASLNYEIIWTKVITNTVGSGSYAVSIVLTLFMAGLGIGSLLCGRILKPDTSARNIIAWYGKIEIFIGIYALIFNSLFNLLRPFFSWNYSTHFDSLFIYHALLLFGCSIVLLPPVIAMGTTLPLLAKYYIQNKEQIFTRLGTLYGYNTLGACLGVLACGFWWMKSYGVSGSNHIGVAINILLGIFCLTVAKKFSLVNSSNSIESNLEPNTSNNTSGINVTGAFRMLLLGSLFITGFCAMAYEVIWTKLISLVLGPTTYSLTLILFAFIFGIGIGSALFSKYFFKISPLPLLIILQLTAAITGLLASHLAGNSPLFFAKLTYTLNLDFVQIQLWRSFLLVILMLPTTICFGIAFPLICGLCSNGVQTLSKTIGNVYFISTLGNILGSLTAGYYFIPFLGKEPSLKIIAALQIVFALFFWKYLKPDTTHKVFRKIIPVICVVAFMAAGYYPHWDKNILSKINNFNINDKLKNISWLKSLGNSGIMTTDTLMEKMIYSGDGLSGFVTVWERTDFFNQHELSLTLSGKADASSRKDMFTQTLLAHFPMLWHPNPKKVMVMGLASGITGGEVLHYPIDKLDILEISPQVIEAAKHFKPWNNSVLTNPKAHVILQDAKSHLLLGHSTYDVIISEPSNPWMAGLADLFTHEFISNAKSSLTDGGIYVQFMHSYQMNWSTFSLVGRTFASVYENSFIIRNLPSRNLQSSGDYLLVGIKGSSKKAIPFRQSKLESIKKSTNVNIINPQTLNFLIIHEDLKALFGEGSIHTEQNPVLEYEAPKYRYKFSAGEVEQHLFQNPKLSAHTREILHSLAQQPEIKVAMVAYALSVYKPYPGLITLQGLDSIQRQQIIRHTKDYCTKLPINDFYFIEDAFALKACSAMQLGMYNKSLPTSRFKANIYLNMGRILAFNESIPGAISYFNKALHIGNNWQKKLAQDHISQLQSLSKTPR